jgi:peptidoglycan/xylan/chitin deacetylase (PgdA/CDA1 family)
VQRASALERGVFTLSLDFELIWGTVDLDGPEPFRRACEVEREIVVDRLLALLAEFEIPATWCIVGHLFLSGCAPRNGVKHPEIVRPSHSWSQEDWFAHDPSGSEQTDPIFYGASLIDKIAACPVPQEIGCHSFSHVIFGDEGCSRETAASELAECVRLARERGLSLESFAFPRNSVGHLDVLRAYGLTCYRGPEPVWYENAAVPNAVKRLAHLADVLVARRPPVVMPVQSAEGLWNIPGSMLYFPMHGARRHIPLSVRVRRAVKGLECAARERKIFHLWFHPTNLADDSDEMFAGLRSIFERVDSLRWAGRLDVAPMGLVTRERASRVGAAIACRPAR